jgi:hypothetical protein
MSQLYCMLGISDFDTLFFLYKLTFEVCELNNKTSMDLA